MYKNAIQTHKTLVIFLLENDHCLHTKFHTINKCGGNSKTKLRESKETIVIKTIKKDDQFGAKGLAPDKIATILAILSA